MPVRLSPGTCRGLAAVALAGASLVAAAATGSLFLSTARDAWAAIGAGGPAGPADGILLAAGLGGTLLSLWLGLGTALTALSALPGALGLLCRQLADRVAPAAVRKAVAFVLGTTLTAAMVPGTAAAGVGPVVGRRVPTTVVAAAQHDDSGRRGPQAHGAPEASFRLVGGRPPIGTGSMMADMTDRTGGGQRSEVTDAAPSPSWSFDGARRDGKTVVVLDGDSLWSIAANRLGTGSTALDIGAEWPRWYAANRDVIGDDANLILPGQLLNPPAPRAAP